MEGVNCPLCNGSGKYEEHYNYITEELIKEDCNACNGTGRCSIEMAQSLDKNGTDLTTP